MGFFLLNKFRVAPALETTAGTLHQLALLVQTQSEKQLLVWGCLSHHVAFIALVTKVRTKPNNFTTASNTGASASLPSLARSPYLCYAGIDIVITPSNLHATDDNF